MRAAGLIWFSNQPSDVPIQSLIGNAHPGGYFTSHGQLGDSDRQTAPMTMQNSAARAPRPSARCPATGVARGRS